MSESSEHHIDMTSKESMNPSSPFITNSSPIINNNTTTRTRKKKTATLASIHDSSTPTLTGLFSPVKKGLGRFGSVIFLILGCWIVFFLYLQLTRSPSTTSYVKLPSFWPSTSFSFFSSSATANSFDPVHVSTWKLRPYVMDSGLEATSGVSVIVSVHHEWNLLARALPNWLEQLNTQIHEIIIVDWSTRSRNQLIPARGNEELLTRDFQQLLNDTRIKIVQLYGSAGTSEYLLPVALNLGTSIATSKSILHLTPDTLILDPNFLRSYSLESETGLFWRGDTSSLEHIDLDTLTESRKRDKKADSEPPYFYTHRFNANFLISRQHYWQVGGIDERFVSHSQQASSVSGIQMDSLPSSSSTSSSFSSSDWSLGSSGGYEILEFYERLSGLTEIGALPSLLDDEPVTLSNDLSKEGDDYLPIRMRSFELKSMTQLQSYPYLLTTMDREWNPSQVVLENVYRLSAQTLPRWHENLKHSQQGSIKSQISGYESSTFLKRSDPKNKHILHAFLQPGAAIGTAVMAVTGFTSSSSPSSALVPTLPFHDLIPPSLQERFLLLSLHQFLFYNLGIPKKVLKKLPMDRLRRISKILDVLPLVEREHMTQRTNAETKADEPSSANRHVLPVEIIQPKLLVLHVFGTVSDRLIALESTVYLFQLYHLSGSNHGGENSTTSTNFYPPRELVVIWPTFTSSGCTTPFHFLLESHNFSILEEYDELMFSQRKFDIYEFDSPEKSYANKFVHQSKKSKNVPPKPFLPFPYNQFDLSTNKHIYIRTDGALTLTQPGVIHIHDEMNNLQSSPTVNEPSSARPLAVPSTKPKPVDIKQFNSPKKLEAFLKTKAPKSKPDSKRTLAAESRIRSAKPVARSTNRQLLSVEEHVHGDHVHSNYVPPNQHWHLTHLLPHRQVRKFSTHALLSISGVKLPMSNEEDLFLNASYYKNHHPFGSQRTRLEQNVIQEEWQIWESIMNDMEEKKLIGIHLDCVEAETLQHHSSTSGGTHVHEHGGQVQVTNEPLNPYSFSTDESEHARTEHDAMLLKWVLGEMDFEISQDSSVVFYVTSFNASSTILKSLFEAYGHERLFSVDLHGSRCHQDEHKQNKWQLKWHQTRCSQLQLAEALVLRHSTLILTNAEDESHGFINLARRITLSSPHDMTHLTPQTTSHKNSHHSHHHRVHSHPVPVVRRMDVKKIEAHHKQQKLHQQNGIAMVTQQQPMEQRLPSIAR